MGAPPVREFRALARFAFCLRVTEAADEYGV